MPNLHTVACFPIFGESKQEQVPFLEPWVLAVNSTFKDILADGDILITLVMEMNALLNTQGEPMLNEIKFDFIHTIENITRRMDFFSG